MQRTARSMTSLLALVLSLGACVPRPHVAGYQLDTELPQGLPDQAPIYRVVESLTPAATPSPTPRPTATPTPPPALS